jgi:hypothetical protein
LRHVTTVSPRWVTAPVPLAVVRWRQARRGASRKPELVSLINVPKVSGTTSRFSLAMATLGVRAARVQLRAGGYALAPILLAVVKGWIGG